MTEFNYRLGRRDAAQVLVGVELSRTHESNEIVAQLNDAGLSCVDLGGDELVKTHVRHLAGGRASGVQNERLFEFEFPERAGALDVFWGRLGADGTSHCFTTAITAIV